LGALKPQVITFTTDAGREADFQLTDGGVTFRGSPVCGVGELPLHERHNVENQMAAMGAGWCLGLKLLVRTVNGRRYINDSKATNLHALETCLRSQDEPVVLIAGGKEKGLDYTPFRPLVIRKVTAIVTIGEIADKLTALFSDLVPCCSAATVPDAVRIATEIARPGQSIVFSPGTSSFDMFSGYAERGNVFRDAVLALADAPS
jgi:UDP-N-acetylmuramoylalanine--D-glutamate ligase